MQIDWANFTPLLSLFGGILIGLAVSLLLLLNGKIGGISGIIGKLLQYPSNDTGWRIFFLLGMIAAPITYRFIIKSPTIIIDTNLFILTIAGLLVGFGTQYGSGCTSGHGVCGIAQLSLRSFIATLTFMVMGFITVFFMRHMIGG